jgi:hypothetical protein
MGRVPDTNEHALIAARRLRRMIDGTVFSSGRILCQLASPLVLAVGCSPAPPSNDEGGVTTNPGSNDGDVDSADAESMEESGSLEEEGVPEEEEGESGVKLDVSPVADLPPPPPQCWMEWWTEMDVVAMYPDCTLGPFDGNLQPSYFHLCVGPVEGDCSEICPPEMLCEGMGSCYWTSWFDMCGPYQTDDGSCCLAIAGEDPPPIGRPFWVAGELRLASVDEVPCDREAAHWLEMARGEHASIAAFARFVAILQQLGAPARLVAEALAAAADEARHAEQTLALASWFCGRELVFGPLAIDDALADRDDIEAIVRAVVREGCIDETLAAHEAACMAAQAEHPRVAEVLERIADDEARHAALAWRFVAWMLGQRPQLRSVVAEVFAQVDVPIAWERRVGLRELVEPCAAQLLGRAWPSHR